MCPNQCNRCQEGGQQTDSRSQYSWQRVRLCICIWKIGLNVVLKWFHLFFRFFVHFIKWKIGLNYKAKLCSIVLSKLFFRFFIFTHLNRIYTHYQESFSPLYTKYISKHKLKKKMQSPFFKNVFQILVFILTTSLCNTYEYIDIICYGTRCR